VYYPNIFQRGALRVLSLVTGVDYRSSLSDPEKWFLQAVNGRQTITQKTITDEVALTSSAVYAAVNLISNSIAQLPLHLMKKEGKSSNKATDHPLYDLLHSSPTEDHTSFEWRNALQGHLGLRGVCFAQIRRDKGGTVRELPILNPDHISPRRPNSQKGIVYAYTPPDGESKIFKQEQILNVRGFGSDGITAYTPIEVFAETIGTALSQEEYVARFFTNSARPAGVLEVSQKLSDKAYKHLKESWKALQGGLENAHEAAILEGGTKWRDVGLKNTDAQLLEQRKYSVTDIARIYGVPAHKIGDMSGAKFRNLEEQNISYVQDTLLAWLIRWEQRLDRSLLLPSERAAGYFFMFELKGLLRGDLKARSQWYKDGKQNGYFSTNDIRSLEDMPPISEEAGGNLLLVNGNMISLAEAGKPRAVKPAPAEELSRRIRIEQSNEFSILSKEKRTERSIKSRFALADTFVPVLSESVGRLVRRESKAFRALLKKHLPKTDQRLFGRDEIGGSLQGKMESRNRADFLRALVNFYNSFPTAIDQNLRESLKAYSLAVVKEVSEELSLPIPFADLEDNFDEFMEVLSQRYIASSQGQIESLLRNAETQSEANDKISERLDEWEEKKAGKTAKNEATRAGAFIAASAYAFGGVITLIWRARAAECPLCKKLNGRKVGIGRNFLSTGDIIDPGGGISPLEVKRNIKNPPLHQGCRCSIVPEI
jgi:HK97 family phage portal protein